MTCEEFKKTVEANSSPFDLTRGERLGMLNHVNICKSCRDYTMNDGPSPSQEDWNATVAACIADHNDPEFKPGKTNMTIDELEQIIDKALGYLKDKKL